MFRPTILEFDWLRKRATPCVTPAFTCPETSANRFSNTSMRRKSQVFLWNETFLFVNVRCEAKGNISDGIKGLVILLKGKYSFILFTTLLPAVWWFLLTRRLTGYSFRVLFSNLPDSIFFHLRKYMISRNSPANKNLAALSHVCLSV